MDSCSAVASREWGADYPATRNSPVVGQFICELAMLQRGWDDLMNAIYHFLSTVGSLRYQTVLAD